MASITELPAEIRNRIHSYIPYIAHPVEYRGYMLSCKQLYAEVTSVVLGEYDKVIELVKKQWYENTNTHVTMIKPESAGKPILEVFLPFQYFRGIGKPWQIEYLALRPEDYSPDPLNPLLDLYLSKLEFKFHGNLEPVSSATGYPEDYAYILFRLERFFLAMKRRPHRTEF